MIQRERGRKADTMAEGKRDRQKDSERGTNCREELLRFSNVTFVTLSLINSETICFKSLHIGLLLI